MNTPTPLPPPQGVMAPAEALAVLDRQIGKMVPILADDLRQARETFSALLARCEGLEAALRVLLEEAENFSVSGVYFNEPCMGHKGPDLARALLAATRTTGGDGNG